MNNSIALYDGRRKNKTSPVKNITLKKKLTTNSSVKLINTTVRYKRSHLVFHSFSLQTVSISSSIVIKAKSVSSARSSHMVLGTSMCVFSQPHI